MRKRTIFELVLIFCCPLFFALGTLVFYLNYPYTGETQTTMIVLTIICYILSFVSIEIIFWLIFPPFKSRGANRTNYALTIFWLIFFGFFLSVTLIVMIEDHETVGTSNKQKQQIVLENNNFTKISTYNYLNF